MYIFFIIISIIICVLLVLMVLIQNPKGGGLSSNFSSSSQLMGVQKTGDFLEKGTWGLAIALMVLSIAINVSAKGGSTANSNTDQKEIIDKASKPSGSSSTAPLIPSSRPTGQPTGNKKKP